MNLSMILTNARERERFLRFLVVGALGFVVDFGSFNLLHSLGVGLWIAQHLAPSSFTWLYEHLLLYPQVIEQSLSFTLAVISNFLWNYFWLYPEAKGANQTKKIISFVVVSVVGLILGVPIYNIALYLYARLVSAYALSFGKFDLAGNLALMTRVGILLFWNFFVNRFVTYKDVK
jgi:putative flippase GtrA